MGRFGIFLVAVICFHVGAEEFSGAENSIRVEELAPKNAVEGNIDEDITNAKMRAESGSKSRFSLSAQMKYMGGSVNRPLNALRPSLSNDPGTQTLSSLSIGPQVRYRWSKNDSVTAGNDFAVMTPLQGSSRTPSGGHVDQFNVQDPSVAYNRAGKLGAFQTNTSIGSSYATSNESRAVSNTFSPDAQGTMLYAFESGLSLGTSMMVQYAFYANRPGANPRTVTDSYGHDERNSYALGVYPFLEYSFNDRYSFRTLFGYFNFVHRYGDPNPWRLLQDYVYQSAGVGIAITRDIYLYPNVQISPMGNNSLSADRTNVGLQATLNVF